MATAISNLVLAQLYERADRAPSNGKTVLVACVEGELHELPARLVADALDNAGFNVRYLGASMPIPSLLQMIKSYAPNLVALSATMSFHASALRETVMRVRAEHPNLPLAVGGGACAWDENLAKDISADITATSATELVSAARAALGVNQ
jgi:MerR family transcriptional regulator, light-induced transcriptional regulator